MKQYKFTIVVRSPLDVKDMVWAFTHKLKDAFPIVSISFDEVSDRPTSVEHHGGVESDDELTHYRVNADGTKTDLSKEYKDIPERY